MGLFSFSKRNTCARCYKSCQSNQTVCLACKNYLATEQARLAAEVYRAQIELQKAALRVGGMTYYPNIPNQNWNSQAGGLVSYGQHRTAPTQTYGGATGQPGTGPSGAGALTPAQAAYIAANSEPRCTIENAGIRAGEIIAYRVWNIRELCEMGFRLYSMAVGVMWQPGIPMSLAQGPNYPDMPPDKLVMLREHSGNGVHAFKTMKDCREEYQPSGCHVYGTVALWGTVIEHERGYRSEFGKIISLDHYDGGFTLLEKLSKIYGVPHGRVDTSGK